MSIFTSSPTEFLQKIVADCPAEFSEREPIQFIFQGISAGFTLVGTHTMLTEATRSVIFQCFPRYAVANILKNNLVIPSPEKSVIAGLPWAGWERKVRSLTPFIRLFWATTPSFQHINNRSVPMRSKIRQGSSAAQSHCQSRNIRPAIATVTRPWHALFSQPLLPCPTSPPLFTCQAERSVGPYRHLLKRNLLQIETAKVEHAYDWRTGPRLQRTCHSRRFRVSAP